MSSLLALLLVLQLAVAATPLPQLFDEALAASRSGDFAGALPLWNQVLELAPRDAAAWSNRGNVQLALGDPLAAIADQTRAMELDPASADPHLNRGTAEEALQRWDAAEADYRWILERDAEASRPLDASALYNLGNVMGSRGDWSAARDLPRDRQSRLARDHRTGGPLDVRATHPTPMTHPPPTSAAADRTATSPPDESLRIDHPADSQWFRTSRRESWPLHLSNLDRPPRSVEPPALAGSGRDPQPAYSLECG